MYYFELLSVLFLLLVFGLIFNPLFGGCLVLLVGLFFFFVVAVLFSLNFIWLILAGVVIYLIGFIIKYYRWFNLPDINEYMKSYSLELPTNGKIKCCKCGSTSLEHHGLFNERSRWRYYTCAQCGTILYKFKVL